MLIPVGTENLDTKEEGNYVIHYKKMDGCIKYTKYFKNPLKLRKCIKFLSKRKYDFKIYEEVGI